MLLRTLSGANQPLKREKWSIFGAPRLKKATHRRFGGVEICCRFLILDLWPKMNISIFKNFFLSFLFVKWINSAKTLVIPFLTKKMTSYIYLSDLNIFATIDYHLSKNKVWKFAILLSSEIISLMEMKFQTSSVR